MVAVAIASYYPVVAAQQLIALDTLPCTGGHSPTLFGDVLAKGLLNQMIAGLFSMDGGGCRFLVPINQCHFFGILGDPPKLRKNAVYSAAGVLQISTN